MGRPCQRSRQHDADAQRQLLVHERQHPRQAARLPALSGAGRGRRLPEESATRSPPRATRDSNWRSRRRKRNAARAGRTSATRPARHKIREETMINNSYYSQDVHGPYELHDIGNLELEEGGTIRGCKLACATFGTLNAASGQRHPDPDLVLRHQQDHRAGLYRQGPRARSRQVFHHRCQSDRQRSFHLAAQHAGAGRHGKFPACAHRRRCARAAQACDGEIRPERASRWSSAAPWARSRPTNGRCAIPTW